MYIVFLYFYNKNKHSESTAKAIYYILCKFAWESYIFIGLQEGDILVCHPLEQVTIFCLSPSGEPGYFYYPFFFKLL